MIHLHEYIKAQNEDKKPLYQWARFDGYRVVSRALTRLDRAVAKFEKVRLPVAFVKTYLSRATQISLTVSQAAVFSMGVMGEKAASCIDEIEESTLSAEGKVNAQAVITEELKKLLKHCAKATDRVYTTLDLLRNSLHIDKSNDDADISMLKVLVAESQARLNTPRKSWFCSGARIILGAATSAVIALTVAHLYNTGGFELAHQTNPNSMHSQVISLVQRAQAVTNLTGEIYSIKLEDLGQRYKELEAASESHGLRIDNLVEALGVPNEDGTYFSSKAKADVPPEIDCRVENGYPCFLKASAEADSQVERLRRELELMRKNIHRMDIRLMKRLDKVDRNGR